MHVCDYVCAIDFVKKTLQTSNAEGRPGRVVCYTVHDLVHMFVGSGSHRGTWTRRIPRWSHQWSPAPAVRSNPRESEGTQDTLFAGVQNNVRFGPPNAFILKDTERRMFRLSSLFSLRSSSHSKSLRLSDAFGCLSSSPESWTSSSRIDVH